MRRILSAVRRGFGTLLAIAGLVMLTGSSDNTAAQLLCLAGSLVALYLGYKLATAPARYA